MVGSELAHVAAEPLAGWSPSLLRTLADVFSTLEPSAADLAPRRAHLAAETLNAVTDPDELRLLKIAVGALNWAPAVGLTTGRWSSFARLDQRGREAVLLAWANSPIPRLRTAFQALKRLGLFLAYADPGADGAGSPLWPGIGYGLAEPALATPEPSLQPMAIDDTTHDELLLEADAVIVGSGAGGAVVAARLAAAGQDVLVVEAGPYLSEREMPVLEAEAFSRLYLDRGTTATSDLGITILAGSGVGGGTTINWTTSFAPPDWLRDEWEEIHGLEGITAAQTDADIARLRAELDLRPPSVIPAKDQAILDGAAALGWEAAPTERNAGPCDPCGACGFGCRYGAKRSGLRAHLANAARDGARLLADARAERVTLADGAATGVIGALTSGQRRPFRIRARRVVIAAGSLRTPLILHASGVTTHPQLGRNLHLHPTVAVAATMAGPVEMWLGPTQAARSLEFWQPGPASADGIGPAHGGFVIESAPAHPGLLASALPWQGSRAAAGMMGGASRMAPLIGIIRDQGIGHVHWTLHRRARIDYRLAAEDGETARRAVVELARLARATGAEELIVAAQTVPPHRFGPDPRGWDSFLRSLSRTDTAANRLSLFSAHQMGSARAGGNPKDYPCDPHGRVRADDRGSPARGLYVADASLFPSASGVNPMLSVMVLAERSARAVLADS